MDTCKCKGTAYQRYFEYDKLQQDSGCCVMIGPLDHVISSRCCFRRRFFAKICQDSQPPIAGPKSRTFVEFDSDSELEFSYAESTTDLAPGSVTAVLLLTIVINVTVIIDSLRKIQTTPNQQQAFGDIDSAEFGENVVRMEGRSIKHVTIAPRTIALEVYASRMRVYMAVDEAVIYEDRERNQNRGIHIVVLNQATGSIMAERHFDTAVSKEDEAMLLFLSMLSPGRLILMASKGEISLQLKKQARDFLSRLGSTHAQDMAPRDTWAMVAVKADNDRVGEDFREAREASFGWAPPVVLKTGFALRPRNEAECVFAEGEVNDRRRRFCGRYEGFGLVCHCKRPAPITFTTLPLEEDNVWDVPVLIIASDRPHYLYRMLRSLLAAHGVNPAMITVYIDGYFEAPLEVARLFGVNAVQHTPLGEAVARVSQHYRASLTATFNLYPKARYVIILEEDLDVSTDFFSYFSQTLPVLETDPSLYCVSAWNSLGFEHTSTDPALLYRVETVSSLGLTMKKSLFKEELEANWPTSENQIAWHVWLQSDAVRKKRECIIPDVSRTFHFGAQSAVVGNYAVSTANASSNQHFQQDVFYNKRILNTEPHVRLKDPISLKYEQYEEFAISLVQSAVPLNHGAEDPCSWDQFISNTSGATYILFITMEHHKDFSTWSLLARCWGLTERGVDISGHRGLWRFFLKSNHIIVVGSPASEYATYKPDGIVPITLQTADWDSHA